MAARHPGPSSRESRSTSLGARPCPVTTSTSKYCRKSCDFPLPIDPFSIGVTISSLVTDCTDIEFNIAGLSNSPSRIARTSSTAVSRRKFLICSFFGLLLGGSHDPLGREVVKSRTATAKGRRPSCDFVNSFSTADDDEACAMQSGFLCPREVAGTVYCKVRYLRCMNSLRAQARRSYKTSPINPCGRGETRAWLALHATARKEKDDDRRRGKGRIEHWKLN